METTSFLGLKKPAYTDAADVQVLNDNVDIIEKALGARSRVFNLLHDSDFTNVINQRGEDIYATTKTVMVKYAIDRWQLVDTYVTASDNSNMNVLADGSVYYIALSKQYGQFRQWVPNYDKYKGKTLTLAMYCHRTPTKETLILLINTGNAQKHVHLTNGINLVSMVIPDDATQLMVAVQNNSTDNIAAFYPAWAALYEGEYTAETLPEYVPKGYAVELAECQRYFRAFDCDLYGFVLLESGNSVVIAMPLDPPMRTGGQPTVTIISHGNAVTANGEKSISASYQGTTTPDAVRYVFYCAETLPVSTPVIVKQVKMQISLNL